MKQFGKFLGTSLLVTGVSVVLIYLLTEKMGLWYMYSAVLVSVGLTIISFTINYWWTWNMIREKEKRLEIASRFGRYIGVGVGVMILTWGLLYVLTEFAHLWYILSLMIVWIVGMIIAFVVNNCWTYRHESITD